MSDTGTGTGTDGDTDIESQSDLELELGSVGSGDSDGGDDGNGDGEDLESQNQVNSSVDAGDEPGLDFTSDAGVGAGARAQSDIEKGKAIQNQLRFWDSLLEIRIRLQKLLVEANKLPQNEAFHQILGSHGPNPDGIPNVQKNLTELLNSFLELDDLMTMKEQEGQSEGVNEDGDEDEEIPSDDETIDGIKSKNPEEPGPESDEDVDSEEEEEEAPKSTKNSKKRKLPKSLKIDDYEIELKRRFDTYKPQRDSIIQKWNDKTQVSTSGKFNNSNSKNYAAFSFQTSTLKQIHQILLDKSRLITRTQIKRSEYEIIGKDKETQGEQEAGAAAETDPEIFDDDDFYHQLLRELIERKASSLSNPIELSTHWLELQKLRSKSKRKVDTKASKARKIRYEVYSKLINFMAPFDSNPMTERGVSELFNSLFGCNSNSNQNVE